MKPWNRATFDATDYNNWIGNRESSDCRTRNCYARLLQPFSKLLLGELLNPRQATRGCEEADVSLIPTWLIVHHG